MATRTKTREPLPLVTEESLLNEAMECPTNRSLETRPLAEERAFASWPKGIPGSVPVTYMNSAASLKAFCGRNGGIVCTSSNAAKVYDWSFERGKRVLFFPHQHLGRNTGLKHGIGLDEMPVWDYPLPYGSLGGNALEQLERSRVILWKGHCSVHLRFTVEQVEKARRENPGITVIVHP